MALGETQIVQETRQFLLDNQVSLDSFSQVCLSSAIVAVRVCGARARVRCACAVRSPGFSFLSHTLTNDPPIQAAAPRSTTVILVKNLPAGVTATDLEELFSAHGSLGRVLLPPSGLTAIVEFLEPTEAKRAFKRLAYSKVRGASHQRSLCLNSRLNGLSRSTLLSFSTCPCTWSGRPWECLWRANQSQVKLIHLTIRLRFELK